MRFRFPLSILAALLVVPACFGGGSGSPTGGTGGGGGAGGGSDGKTITSTSGSSTGGSSTTSGAGGTGGSADCVDLCTYVYACGADGRCPGFADISENEFVYGADGDGCFQQCEGPTGTLLQGLVDPNDCDATVDTLEAASADFAVSCNGQVP